MSDDKNVFQKIGDAVVDYAPALAGVLALVPGAGAVPAAAISALGALGKSLGLGTNAKPEDVLAAVTADPEIRLKAIVAENEFKLGMREADIEELKAKLADVQSARNRQIEHEKATGKSDINLYVLAWVLVIGFFGLTGMLLYFSYEGKSITDTTGTLFMLMGTMATCFGMVVGYFFGSSVGSAQKSDIITQMGKGRG